LIQPDGYAVGTRRKRDRKLERRFPRGGKPTSFFADFGAGLTYAELGRLDQADRRYADLQSPDNRVFLAIGSIAGLANRSEDDL
jgi:hypothetical protein